uniref:Protein tyrosine phosphatase non-receptor type 20 n=1 Tax=Gopherus evgoodei TaxID=1825980 RepID=A0A8C4VYV8_9SAUR
VIEASENINIFLSNLQTPNPPLINPSKAQKFPYQLELTHEFGSPAEIAKLQKTFSFCPDDATRVPLGATRGYINASYIRTHIGEEEHFYISTQGPLPCTVADFWQMIWENESDVIAMMTKEVELGKVKCHRYWPEPPQHSLDFITPTMKLTSVVALFQTGERRFVKHLQFTTWPDHGTPRLIEHLVKFIRYMRKIHQTGPITAHCSAGIGRSGVLLCIDILLSCIEKDLCIVRELRHQRFGMIQTKVRSPP